MLWRWRLPLPAQSGRANRARLLPHLWRRPPPPRSRLKSAGGTTRLHRYRPTDNTLGIRRRWRKPITTRPRDRSRAHLRTDGRHGEDLRGRGAAWLGRRGRRVLPGRTVAQVVVDQGTGAHGHAAAFSFYPTKNLGAYGDGGAVTSNDASLIEKVKSLREGGHPTALNTNVFGRNSRLDELQAAVLRTKLTHLEEWNLRRLNLAKMYCDELSGAGNATSPYARRARRSRLSSLRRAT